jgi:hypothetical protein
MDSTASASMSVPRLNVDLSVCCRRLPRIVYYIRNEVIPAHVLIRLQNYGVEAIARTTPSVCA